MISRLKMTNQLIYYEPVRELIKKINDAPNKNIILAGNIGTGKSTVLNALIDNNKNPYHLIMDSTEKFYEFIHYYDIELANLYHICLIIHKILQIIKKRSGCNISYEFANIEKTVTNIMAQVKEVYCLGAFDKKNYGEYRLLYKNPEILIEALLKGIAKELDINIITLILDDFDVIGESSPLYQISTYNILSKYMRLIMAVSDEEVLNNQDRQQELSENNEIVVVDYSSDVETVKRIIDAIFIKELFITKNIKFNHRISYILNDDTIKLIIEKTNGNIYNISSAIRSLYTKLDELTQDEYDSFILNFIDQEINKDINLGGLKRSKRKLYI